jgi:potassium uptake TrkH family protein
MPILLDTGEGRLRRILDLGSLACGVCALGLLVVEFGFALTPESRASLLSFVRIVLWAIVLVQLARSAMDALAPRRTFRCYVRLASHAAFAGLLAFEGRLVPPLAGYFGLSPEGATLAYLTLLHVTAVGLLARRLLDLNQGLAFARISPRTILIGSYVMLILLGTTLLRLPNATHTPLSWLDALFTSTSAVSVTGLIVVDTATVFTPSGQMVILFLLQLGGLGLMTFTYFFVVLFGSGLTLKDRSLLLDFLNEDHVGQVRGSLIAMIAMTFACEAAGAVLLWNATPGEPWFASVFHSVSAFCNAGFSIYTDGLYDLRTRDNGYYQAVVMTLIVIGGLGFPVLKNVLDSLRGRFVPRLVRRPRLTTHSRLVIATSAVLIVAGALLIFTLEQTAGADDTRSEGFLTALFASVTARTAGFNTVPMEAFSTPAVVLLMVLMFIGGSPASTAGGIKTTTFAVALLNTLRILRDASGELVAFRRRIPPGVATRAFAVALLAFGWVTVSTILLLWTMPDQPPLDVAFEAVSAFATVGLSRGITPELTAMGKVIIIASMLVGRIGILYLALGILRKPPAGRIGYPDGNVIIS